MQAGLVCGSEGAWVGGVMAGGWGGWQWVAEMDGGGGAAAVAVAVAVAVAGAAAAAVAAVLER